LDQLQGLLSCIGILGRPVDRFVGKYANSLGVKQAREYVPEPVIVWVLGRRMLLRGERIAQLEVELIRRGWERRDAQRIAGWFAGKGSSIGAGFSG
jgi:hypothetical protein